MRVKVAVVGAGAMGMNHLRVLRDFNEDEIELVGVADSLDANLQRAVNRFHVAGFSDYRQMVERTAPDLVSVVVPTYLHFAVASHLLDQGINVLLEKPMTSTPEEAAALIQLAHLRGVKLAIGHVERFNPAIIEVKRHLVAGELGQLFHLHARRLGPFPQRIHATHEDALLGILHFANEAMGMLDVNWLTPTKVRELSVTGERGMYLINYLTQDVYFYENDYTPTSWDTLRTMAGVSEGTMTRLKVQKAEPLRLEYEDVLAAIRNDCAPRVSGEDGLAVLRVVCRLSETAARREAAQVQQAVEVKVEL